MANFNITGFEEMEKELFHESERATKKVPLMLNAAADVLVRVQKAQMNAMKLVDTGAMAKSIKKSKLVKGDGDSVIYVRPTGRDKKGIRNAEKAFIAEYGKRGQPPKPWMSTANATSEGEAHSEMLKIWAED